MYLRNSFLILLLLIITGANAQTDPQLNAPYSRFGIGELREDGNIRTMGMGGAGVASMQPGFINYQNPALLSRTRIRRHLAREGETFETIGQLYSISEENLRAANRRITEVKPGQMVLIPTRKYTMWDAALRTDIRSIRSGDNSFSSGGLLFDHFVYGVPLQRRWTAAFGLQPYSQVYYNVNLRSSFAGDTAVALITDQGRGGLYQVFISNGFDITEKLAIGLQTGYLFGNIDREVFTSIENEPAGESTGQLTTSSYSGLIFKPGLTYGTRISRSSHEDSLINFSFGAMAEFHAATFVGEETRISTRNLLGATISDTIIGQRSGYVNFPSSYTAGIAMNRPNRWAIAADFRYSTWQNLTQFSRNDSLRNTFRISVGGELNSPDTDPIRINKPVYRAGLFYGTTPYVIGGNNISERGITLGASIPVSRRAHLETERRYKDKKIPYTMINLALTVGQRGTTEHNLAREMFFTLQTGIIITDKWFIKRKIQ